MHNGTYRLPGRARHRPSYFVLPLRLLSAVHPTSPANVPRTHPMGPKSVASPPALAQSAADSRLWRRPANRLGLSPYPGKALCRAKPSSPASRVGWSGIPMRVLSACLPRQGSVRRTMVRHGAAPIERRSVTGVGVIRDRAGRGHAREGSAHLARGPRRGGSRPHTPCSRSGVRVPRARWQRRAGLCHTSSAERNAERCRVAVDMGGATGTSPTPRRQGPQLDGLRPSSRRRSLRRGRARGDRFRRDAGTSPSRGIEAAD
jgi:hypothetical protein